MTNNLRSRFLVLFINCCTLFLSAYSQGQSSIASQAKSGIAIAKPTDGRYVEYRNEFLVPYTVTIPGTKVTFDMIPIPGGTFKMGSSPEELNRSSDEGPQIEVAIEPFWIGRTEVTWSEYKTFMSIYQIFKRLQSSGVRRVTEANRVDAITVPTPLYEPSHTYEYGDDPQQPAVTMTQYAAKQYCKWLSGMLGQQLRLPSEAEWEYAARGGTQSAYSFGDDANLIGDYACFQGNNTGGPAKVATKKPNPFGLYDMHGNAWEWTIDSYSKDGHADMRDRTLNGYTAIKWPTKQFPRTVRGGGWQDDPSRLRSAARLGSNDEAWKSEDPNIPHSPWWYTSDPARGVGFRMVRSAKDLEPSAIRKFWEIDNEDIQLDVEQRLNEGRGAIGLPVPELRQELEANR